MMNDIGSFMFAYGFGILAFSIVVWLLSNLLGIVVELLKPVGALFVVLYRSLTGTTKP